MEEKTSISCNNEKQTPAPVRKEEVDLNSLKKKGGSTALKSTKNGISSF